jgi:hypothetical protein
MPLELVQFATLDGRACWRIRIRRQTTITALAKTAPSAPRRTPLPSWILMRHPATRLFTWCSPPIHRSWWQLWTLLPSRTLIHLIMSAESSLVNSVDVLSRSDSSHFCIQMQMRIRYMPTWHATAFIPG